MTYLLEFIRLFIAFVFLLSVVGKARNFESFHQAVAAFRLVPIRYTGAVAKSFFAAECLVVVALFVGGEFTSLGMIIAGALLLAFSFGITVALLRKQRLSCNCFGQKSQRISLYDLVRNGILISSCVFGVLLSTSSLGVPLSLETFFLGFSALGFALIVANFSDVLQTLIYPFRFGGVE